MTDILPLDRYPQIVFSPDQNVTDIVSHSGDRESVTTATVTLSAAPQNATDTGSRFADLQSVTRRHVTYSSRPEPGTYDIEPAYPEDRDHNFDQYGRQINRCFHCRKWFHTSRYDKKTCTANCRKALSRRNEAIQSEVQHVQAAIATLERYSDKWPDLFQDIMQAIGQCGTAASSASRRVAPKGDNR